MRVSYVKEWIKKITLKHRFVIHYRLDFTLFVVAKAYIKSSKYHKQEKQKSCVNEHLKGQGCTKRIIVDTDFLTSKIKYIFLIGVGVGTYLSRIP